jgi:hypothetical protein
MPKAPITSGTATLTVVIASTIATTPTMPVIVTNHR